MAPFAPDLATPLPEDDFQPNAFPLEPGLRLLEASAGTGKTFALAHLSLRLLTERAIPLRRLLVVTFTDAAAAELRERIGRRLQQALTGLQDPGWEPPDAVLADWLAEQRRSARAGETVMRLLLALEDLDGADITTIHGFCQRSLQRHALEAQRPPGLTLDSEGDTLLEQVVHSYWQGQVLGLPPHLIRGLSRQGMKTKALRSLLRTLDSDPGLELDPLPEELPVDTPLDAALPELWRQRWHQFAAEWQRRGPALMEALFTQAGEWKASGAEYRPYTLKESKKWSSGVVDTFIAIHGDQGEPPPYDAVLGQEMVKTFLHPGTFCKVAREAEGIGSRPNQLPESPLMEAVAAMVDGPAELALLHACHWGRRELARRRQSLGLCSYAELLSGLDPGAAATAPTPLLAAVAGRYSAALIDEFQDTDPIQWRILRLAFGGGEHLLVMVGDPKQAIYRFRGGDLATYLAARAAAQRCYQMRENRRSTPELIEALNAFFDRGLPRSNLAMPRMEAKADRGGDGQVPMELLWLGRSSSLPRSSEVNLLLPAQMAAYVAQLLANPPRLLESTGERALEPDDICFLVGTHAQAEDLRQALQDLGIASRLVSQADVFTTPAATAVQRLLDALADPADANRLRLLAASPLLGWNAETLREAPPLHWSALASRLQRMAQVWPQQGLLGSLGAVLTPEQMASHAKGGRFLADLQQVTELVQQRVHREQLGPHATARWLRRRRQAELERVPEAEQTHSDKVRQAVSVVTVHRSKGLEYPVVICPYLWLDGGKPQGEGRRWQRGSDQPPRLDLHRNRSWGDGYLAERDHQVAQEAERERLAYVALTRAMHRLVVAWVPAKDRECNPLYPWLFVNEPVPDVEEHWPDDTPLDIWRQRLSEQIAERRLPLRLLDPPALDLACLPSPRQEGAIPLATGPVPRESLYRGWARSSYTSWTHGRARDEGPRLPAEAVEEGRDTSDPEPEEGTVLEARPPTPEAMSWPDLGPWADLPRGSGFGECLHRVLEQIDYGSPLPSPALQTVVTHELRRAGLDERWAPPLLDAIPQMLSTPFGGELGGLRPADLHAQARMNELHFDLSLHHVRAADLARAFGDHPGGAFGEAYAAALSQLPVNHCGFLTGSIDLIFPDPATERWWVLDWKSNWLGRRDGQGRTLSCGPGDYGTEVLQSLMASHHYPLQAHLYLVALHRYLAWRLPSYGPEQHLGGYAYVFVRGTPGASGQDVLPGPVPGMVVERPPLERLLALDRALGTAPSGWEPGMHP